jgi:DDE family transposase
LFISKPERWLKAGVFEALVYDLRAVLRIAEGRQEMPTAAIFDSRTMQSTPESGGRSGYNGAKRRKGNKVHLAVDTLGHLLALCVTAADEQDRAQVSELAKLSVSGKGTTLPPRPPLRTDRAGCPGNQLKPFQRSFQNAVSPLPTSGDGLPGGIPDGAIPGCWPSRCRREIAK